MKVKIHPDLVLYKSDIGMFDVNPKTKAYYDANIEPHNTEFRRIVKRGD